MERKKQLYLVNSSINVYMYMCNKHIYVNNRVIAFLVVNGKNDDDMMIPLPRKLGIM